MNVPYRQELVIVLLLIILPLLFVPVGGYYQWLLGYTYVMVLQGYVAWFLFYKVGQSFFGYSGLLGAGAYATGVALNAYHWDILAATLLAMCVAAAISVAMFLATARQRGFYMGLTSFLIVILIQGVAAASPILGKSWGISIVGKGLREMIGFNAMYLLVSMATVACVGVLFWIMRTETGKVLTLICQNEELARAVGIYTGRYRIIAYLVGGIISGFGGAMFINYIGVVTPEDVSMTVTMKIFFLPMIGGPAFHLGPLLGGFIVIWLLEIFKSVEYYLPILIGISYILVIGLAPEGIGGYLANYARRTAGTRKT